LQRFRLAGIDSLVHKKAIGPIGTRFEETGMLLQEPDGFILRRDLGGRWRLDLHRVGTRPAGARVRVTGTIVDKDLVDVDDLTGEDELGVAA